ncbi:SLOG family protein [Hungatella hathewayi]|uniref:SLOG family protein n=1 Tax=Hungatella hathewayi TaxID=154046 RepID=UPI0011DDF5B8|nr:SLOG family protein [Hungatella hathewayi]
MEVISCAVTGHRPTRFKFKYKEDTAGCKRLKKRLHDQFVLLHEKGVRQFYVGGALGVDMWAAEILLRLKEQQEYSEINLVVVLPFEGHDAKWDERSKKRMRFIRHHAEVIVAGATHNPESYLKRNRYMVDRADYLVAVYDNDHTIRSGTGMTVNYAHKKRQLPVILIHPDTAAVTKL